MKEKRYVYLAQCKWYNAFTVSFRDRFRVRNRDTVRVRVRIRVRDRVRQFSPLRHLHCAEYRKPKKTSSAHICGDYRPSQEFVFVTAETPKVLTGKGYRVGAVLLLYRLGDLRKCHKPRPKTSLSVFRA